jgi:hypothetical protein
VRRRDFIAGLRSDSWPLAARAQQACACCWSRSSAAFLLRRMCLFTMSQALQTFRNAVAMLQFPGQFEEPVL